MSGPAPRAGSRTSLGKRTADGDVESECTRRRMATVCARAQQAISAVKPRWTSNVSATFGSSALAQTSTGSGGLLRPT
eukprot:5800237-Pleurochrysis_carterae.AAC.2